MIIGRIKDHLEYFRHYIIPFKRKFILILLMILIISLLSLTPPLFLKYLLDNVLLSKNYSGLILVITAFFLIQLIGGAIKAVMEYWHEYVGAWMIFKIRDDLFRHLQTLSVNFFMHNKQGDILTRLTGDITSIHSIISIVLTSTLPDVTQIIGIIGILSLLNWQLTLLSLVVVPLFFFTQSYFGKKIKKLARITRERNADITVQLLEVFNNIPIVKIFNTHEYEAARHERKSTSYINSTLKMHIVKFLSVFLITMITTISVLIVIGYGGYLVMNGLLTIGSFVAFYTYVIKVFVPLKRVVNYNVSVYSSLASVDRVKEFLSVKPDIVDVENPVELKSVKGKITFSNVSYAHQGSNNSPKKENVLNNISFEILPGEHVALVGKTGAGKTTIINLLCRLFYPQSGTIKIDDTDIRTVSADSLYKNIAIVPQNDMLFNEPVEDNVRYGNKSTSDSFVNNYIKAVGLDRIIESMEEKIKTSIGPQGSKLSGGERKILMIARALVKNTSILIFDEATTAVDTNTESKILKNLDDLLKDKTVITIAHRISTIVEADKILLLNQGSIAGFGTHAELLNTNEFYKSLFYNRSSSLSSEYSYV